MTRSMPLILILGAALAGCGPQTSPAASADDEGAAAADDAEAVASAPSAYERLINPGAPSVNETAPDVFNARFTTSQGDFVIQVQRAWAPNGADRFYNLVNNGFYDEVRFFRVIKGFMAQFGISGDARVNDIWRSMQIQDDPVVKSNLRGFVSYAMRGPNTRTTQIFINYKDNNSLDAQGFSPFGQVIEGMDVVDSLYGGYGEGAPRGRGPNQASIQSQGNEYLKAEFPELDYVVKARIEP